MADNIIDLKEKVAKQQVKITGNIKDEPTKTVKRKVFVYFIPFWWKQGKNTGFACYEQPMTDAVQHIGHLMQSAQNYAMQLHRNQMEQKKQIPWWKIKDKLSISNKDRKSVV